MARMLSGKLRFYINYRKLNNISEKDKYSISLIKELIKRLNKTKIFTKLDIRQGFYRIKINPDSEDLIIFRIRYRLYKYKIIFFRLTNRSAAFQRYINTTFFDYLDRFLIIFINNLLVYNKNIKKYKKHVKLVLKRLQNIKL